MDIALRWRAGVGDTIFYRHTAPLEQSGKLKTIVDFRINEHSTAGEGTLKKHPSKNPLRGGGLRNH